MNPRFENWLAELQNHNDSFLVVAVSGAALALAWLVTTVPNFFPQRVTAFVQRVYLYGGFGMMFGTMAWTVYQLCSGVK